MLSPSNEITSIDSSQITRLNNVAKQSNVKSITGELAKVEKDKLPLLIQHLHQLIQA